VFGRRGGGGERGFFHLLVVGGENYGLSGGFVVLKVVVVWGLLVWGVVTEAVCLKRQLLLARDRLYWLRW